LKEQLKKYKEISDKKRNLEEHKYLLEHTHQILRD